MKNQQFVSIDAILTDLYAGDTTAAIDKAKFTISLLLSIQEYSDEDMSYVQNTLPTMLNLIIELERPSGKIMHQMLAFFELYLELLIKLDLNLSLLRAVTEETEVYKGETNDSKPMKIDEDKVDSLFEKISSGKENKFMDNCDESENALRDGIIIK